jgi:hypothetical protein
MGLPPNIKLQSTLKNAQACFDNGRTKEAQGFLTFDGNFVVVPTVRNGTIDCSNPDGYVTSNKPGGWGLRYGGKGRVYLSYNSSDGTGIKVIQVVAMFHTHPCAAGTAPSGDDIAAAQQFRNLNHYVVDKGGIGQYDQYSTAGTAFPIYYRFTTSTPDLVSLCTKYSNKIR